MRLAVCPKCIQRKTRQRSKIMELRKRAERDIDYAPAPRILSNPERRRNHPP
jgi:hypothetical protein